MQLSRSGLTAVRFLFAIYFVAAAFGADQQPKAARVCDRLGNCRVYLSRRPVTVIAQQTPVWCWAASLSMLFDYYGHSVEQSRIVSRYFALPIPVTGPPWVLRQALNTTWTDDRGKQFQITSRITDLYSGGPLQATNTDVLNALADDQPVFYGDATHAMILVQADYTNTPLGPYVTAGWAIDPWPLSLGFRQLQPQELQATFLAIASVREIATGGPSLASVVNGATFGPGLTSQGFGTIFGERLVSSGRTEVWDRAVVDNQLPTSLAGTRVLVAGRDAFISYASPTQLNFVVPDSDATGNVQVEVRTEAGSKSAIAMLQRRSPGLFMRSSAGRQYAVATIGNSGTFAGPTAAFSGVSSRPVKKGETLVLYATGLGRTTPPAPNGRLITAPFPQLANPASLTVLFDQVAVRPVYAGMTYAGLFQINVVVPPNSRSGNIPIRLQIDSETSPANVFTSVE